MKGKNESLSGKTKIQILLKFEILKISFKFLNKTFNESDEYSLMFIQNLKWL